MLPVSINPTVPTSLSTKTIANHRVFFSGQYCGDAGDGDGDSDGDGDGDGGDVIQKNHDIKGIVRTLIPALGAFLALQGGRGFASGNRYWI